MTDDAESVEGESTGGGVMGGGSDKNGSLPPSGVMACLKNFELSDQPSIGLNSAIDAGEPKASTSLVISLRAFR